MNNNRIPMLPYVLLGTAIKTVIGIGYLVIGYAAPDYDPPNLGTASMFLAAGAAVLWFMRRMKVRMRGSEIFRFASGMALGDLILGISWVMISLLLANEAMDFESMASLVLGEADTGLNAQLSSLLAIAAVIGVVSSFVLAALAAWFMTKALPDRDAERFS